MNELYGDEFKIEYTTRTYSSSTLDSHNVKEHRLRKSRRWWYGVYEKEWCVYVCENATEGKVKREREREGVRRIM